MIQDMLDNDYFLGALKTDEELIKCKPMKYLQFPDSEFKDLDPKIW